MAIGKIKVEQLQSGSQPYGQFIKSDGSGNTIWGGVIDAGITFPSNPTGGTLYYRTDADALFHYDDSRSKWLTVKTLLYSCGRSNIQKNTSAYMYAGGAVQSSTNGFIMTHNGTILSATVDNITIMGTDRNVEFRVNDSAVNRVLLTITAGNKSATTIIADQNFSSGDTIQVVGIANGGTDFNNIIVTFEIGWRI